MMNTKELQQETGAITQEAIGKMLTASTQSHLAQCFVFDGLRTEFQELIGQISETMQVDSDMVFTFMLGAMSIAVGGKCCTRYSYFSPVFANLALAVIAPSGAGKSPVFKGIMKPLKKVQKERFRLYKTQFGEWKASKESGSKPRLRNVFLKDATMEAACACLASQPEGVGFLTDESLIDFVGAYKDKAGAMADCKQVINALDGESISIVRKGDEPLYIDRGILSICGCTQPVDLIGLFSEWKVRKGLPARFLFCFAENKKTQEPATPPAIDYESFWEPTIEGRLVLPPEGAEPLMYPLSPEAFEVIRAYRNRKSSEQQDWEQQGRTYLATMCGKQQVIILRLALVLHFFSPNMHGESISGAEAEYAVHCMDVFESHALRVEQIVAEELHGGRKAPTFYGSVHQAWDALAKQCEETGRPMPSQAQFAGTFGIAKQNFSQKVLTAKY